jgi:hypothetical protein
MSINWQKAGANHVPAYQISGVPYVTGSSGAAEHLNAPKEFTFPFVTKNISFFAEANALHFGFSHHGVNGEPDTGKKHIFRVTQGQQITLDVRCKSVFVETDASCKWSMCAALTTIPSNNFPVLTGSINGAAAFEGIG